VSYAGLAPSARQSSDTERHGKITKRGRKRLRTLAILAVLALSQGPATPLAEFYALKKRQKGAGIPVLIDAEHAIAHNKVTVIDDRTVLTGSFNFSKAAEEKNAENLLVLKKSPELAQAYIANINTHAAHAHPYRRSTAEAIASTEKQANVTGGAIHGTRKSKIYHLPSCSGYEHLSPANVVPFANEAQAVQAGYRKAKNCR